MSCSLQIQQTGFSKKSGLIKFSFYTEAISEQAGDTHHIILLVMKITAGRPVYEIDADPQDRYSKLSDPSFWLDLNFKNGGLQKDATGNTDRSHECPQQ
jgi:hypothetical protein